MDEWLGGGGLNWSSFNVFYFFFIIKRVQHTNLMFFIFFFIILNVFNTRLYFFFILNNLTCSTHGPDVLLCSA